MQQAAEGDEGQKGTEFCPGKVFVLLIKRLGRCGQGCEVSLFGARELPCT